MFRAITINSIKRDGLAANSKGCSVVRNISGRFARQWLLCHFRMLYSDIWRTASHVLESLAWTDSHKRPCSRLLKKNRRHLKNAARSHALPFSGLCKKWNGLMNELWHLATNYVFDYREAFYSVHFHTAIISLIFKLKAHVKLNICIVH